MSDRSENFKDWIDREAGLRLPDSKDFFVGIQTKNYIL